MQPTPEIASFWREFAVQEAAFFQLPPAERVEQINALASQYLHGVTLEVLGAPDATRLELVLTAHGHIEFFPLLSQVTGAAPALAHFGVTAFRARSPDADFSIQMDGLELSTSEVMVVLEQDDGRVALELHFKPEVSEALAEQARHMAFIMLDHVLGEYDFAVKVGAIDFVTPAPDAPVSWTPLSALAQVFDTYWVETLGRTGIFPTGEAHWEGMELQFNCAVDDSGNEIELDDFAWGDDDTVTEEASEAQEAGFVAVNLSADAVAMRADLATAWTLDLPAADEGAQARAQALQDQAGMLLQQMHQGLMVLTLTKEGRRQALYYVVDEALVRQTLAPLLARPEAADAEIKVSFDPAWSGYFEYAGYLA